MVPPSIHKNPNLSKMLSTAMEWLYANIWGIWTDNEHLFFQVFTWLATQDTKVTQRLLGHEKATLESFHRNGWTDTQNGPHGSPMGV